VQLVADGRGRAGGAITRAGAAWGTAVTITFTPADADLLRRYLIEAVREALVPDRERVPTEGRSGAEVALTNARALLRRYLRDIQPQLGSTSVLAR
jgi:hypothetical protein